MRLIEEIAALFAANGCRTVRYRVGVRVYNCKNAFLSDQSLEYNDCLDVECGLTPDETEYGRWGKEERQKYLTVLKDRGLLP